MLKTTFCVAPLLFLTGCMMMAPAPPLKTCEVDAVRVGGVCVDKYEASVWEIAAGDAALVEKVQSSGVTSAADLTGATQRGAFADDYGAGCPDTGSGCKDFYAVSVAGVTPSSQLSWFQAAAACRNAGKRLATNQEWQMAALGTPESACNTAGIGYPLKTGDRAGCVSDTGNFDMVGNLWEWVADWSDRADYAGASCTNWPAGAYGGDVSCVGSAGSDHLPGALLRGGHHSSGTNAGVFAVSTDFAPYAIAGAFAGFRCAREL